MTPGHGNMLIYALLLVLPISALIARRVPILRVVTMLVTWGAAVSARRARTSPARSVEAGTSPISEMPWSLRSSSTLKSGSVIASAEATVIASTTREGSTTLPAWVTARKRSTSVGAVPVKRTCRAFRVRLTTT